MWLYKLIPSLCYFKGNCSRYFTVNGMRPSTNSFILEVKFRGTCLSEVPKPLQSGLLCGVVLANMSKTWLIILRVIQYWNKVLSSPHPELTWVVKTDSDDAVLGMAQHVMLSCKSCDLYSRGAGLEYQLGDTLFE